METLLFTVADAATIDPAGKLNMLGAGFTQINAYQVPVVYKFSFVNYLRFTPLEQGTHTLVWTIIDISRNFIVPPLQAQIITSARFTIIPFVVETLTRFPNFGRYQVDLIIDSSPKASWTIDVEQIYPPQSAGP